MPENRRRKLTRPASAPRPAPGNPRSRISRPASSQLASSGLPGQETPRPRLSSGSGLRAAATVPPTPARTVRIRRLGPQIRRGAAAIARRGERMLTPSGRPARRSRTRQTDRTAAIVCGRAVSRGQRAEASSRAAIIRAQATTPTQTPGPPATSSMAVCRAGPFPAAICATQATTAMRRRAAMRRRLAISAAAADNAAAAISAAAVDNAATAAPAATADHAAKAAVKPVGRSSRSARIACQSRRRKCLCARPRRSRSLPASQP